MTMSRIAILVLWLICPAQFAAAQPASADGRTASPFAPDDRYDTQRVRLDLGGDWQVLEGQEEREVWKEPADQSDLSWKTAHLPGRLVPEVKGQDLKQIKSVWARRVFEAPSALAAQGAVLKTDGVRFGAVFWLNGQELCRYAPVGPNIILIPPGLLRPGENVLLLKVPGWAGLAKSASGYPLIPTGGSTQSWGPKDPMVLATWLEFYQRAYMKWVLAVPDVKNGVATFRIWFDSSRPLPRQLTLTATVRPADEPGSVGSVTAQVKLPADGGPVELRVPIAAPVLWTPQRPFLYVARLEATLDGAICDRAELRFGLRSIEVADGHYQLNGKPLWLRGSNLVAEWIWGDGRSAADRFEPRDYLIEQARAMNLNCFRTHSLPPPTDWSNVCDRGGRMLLAELPVLYNLSDAKFTAAEREIFHANALQDATGYVTRLWNHPAVIVWVLSNESRYDTAWEQGPLRDHVRRLDPTRPCLRAAGETAESVDVHTCGNVDDGVEGALNETVATLAAQKDRARTLGNSEYMNLFHSMEELTLAWTGARPAGRHPQWFSEMLLEHTEALRRAQFDLILPYMYAGWTRRGGPGWRDGFPTPQAAALHSAMSPVLASLDLFDMHYPAGRTMSTRVAMINETGQDVAAQVELIVTPADPLCLPDAAAIRAAISKESQTLSLPADRIIRPQLSWQVPAAEGTYFLACLLYQPGKPPVVSQRRICSVRTDLTGSGLRPRRVLALGVDEGVAALLRRRGVPCATELPAGRIDADVVVLGDGGRIDQDRRDDLDKALLEFVEAGGRVVGLNENGWDWGRLVELSTEPLAASRVFVADSPSAERLLADVPPAFLWRWNGLPGKIVARALRGPLPEGAEPILWARSPDHTVAAAIPKGHGRIVVCLLQFQHRLNPGDIAYDPAAERVLLNLLLRD